MRNKHLLSLGALASAAVLLTPAVATAAEAAPQGGGLSLFGMVFAAGAPEYVLLAFSVAAFAVAIQNFLVLKRPAVIPDGLANDLADALSAEETISEETMEDVKRMVENDPTTLGKTLAATFNASHLGYDAMREAADVAFARETTRWMQKPGWLSMFANAATLLGLFGTVWGIIESFMAMSSNPGGVDIGKLSATIGISLVTTANGMLIAVPMLVFAFMQRSMLFRWLGETTELSLEVLSYFRPVVGPGAAGAQQQH